MSNQKNDTGMTISWVFTLCMILFIGNASLGVYALVHAIQIRHNGAQWAILGGFMCSIAGVTITQVALCFLDALKKIINDASDTTVQSDKQPT